MIYILLIFYTLDGLDIRQEIEQPSLWECTKANQLWLHEARMLGLREAEAHCAGRVEGKRENHRG